MRDKTEQTVVETKNSVRDILIYRNPTLYDADNYMDVVGGFYRLVEEAVLKIFLSTKCLK